MTEADAVELEAAAGDGEWSCRVHGSPLEALPVDLYIPPDALEVFLESFEGPLDLLLYLIRRQNLDILSIPIAEITRQYMAYIEVMQAMRLELAGEYLVMAALLAEIKSRVLLPRPPALAEEEDDPRLALIRQLQEYERFKAAAERLDAIPRLERDVFHAHAARDALLGPPAPAPALEDLMEALVGVLRRAGLRARHQISAEALSVRERMARILGSLEDQEGFVDFVDLLIVDEGRPGVVVAFLAVLELSKAGLLEWGQGAPFGPIQVRRRTEAADAE